jgi:HlyD family secretion protein
MTNTNGGIFRRAFWTGKRLIAAGVVAVLLVGGYVYTHGKKGPEFVTTAAVRGDVTVLVSATGTVQPKNQVDVGAQVSGTVDQVLVDFNDKVKVDQVLAIINTDQLKAQLAQVQATRAQAMATLANNQATVEQTRAKRDRFANLLKQNAVAIQDAQAAEGDYARAVASVAQARATIASADAQIETAQTNISKAVVRSPIDGVVLNRAVSKGQTVASSFTTPVLFTLASDLSVMELDVSIDEADIGAMRVGQSASFVVDAFPQHRFAAQLTSLHNAPKTENGVVSYPGVLSVDNHEGLLRPGLTATADILVAQSRNVLLVPNGALRFTPPSLTAAQIPPIPAVANGQKGGRVWVLEGGKPVARDLVIGNSDGKVTQVISGDIKLGDAVITDVAAKRPAAPAGGAP